MSILYSLFAVCSLAFCQCDKDGGSASGGNLPFELSVSQWNVPSQGATEEVDLQAPGEWKVKTDYIAGGERWLSVSKTSGAAGQHKLTLSAGNNPSNSTDREALLTVTCGNEQKTISVTQRTHEEVVPEQGRYDVKAGDTLLTVNVSANVGGDRGGRPAGPGRVESQDRLHRRRRAVALCQQDVRRRRAAQADAFGRQ